ncbi:hypothetical protein pVa21_108 [Vibrio phage pVa-21]|nr:hypothetical protein pVa21_108 [Vibrio phage pVa-21]
MSTLYFYNVEQTPSDAHRISIPQSTLDEVTELVTQSGEEDNCGNTVAYVEDLGMELEEVLASVNASDDRVAELLSCEFVTTSTLCN